MYTVERIESDKVVLENRDTKETVNVDKKEFDINIRINDIVEYDCVEKIYKTNLEETIKITNNIRNRFNRLKK